jgi:hypothetical protein
MSRPWSGTWPGSVRENASMSDNQDPPSEEPAVAPLEPDGELVRASAAEMIAVGVATAWAAKPYIEMAVTRDTEITVAQTKADADVAIAHIRADEMAVARDTAITVAQTKADADVEIAHIQADAAIRVAEINAEAAQAPED